MRNRRLSVSLAITIGIFVVDVLTPLGYTDWLFYLIPTFVAASALRSSSILYLPSVCTLLVVLGYFLSPAIADPRMDIVNRSMGVIVLWIASLLLLRRKQAQETLEQLHHELEDRVEERTKELSEANKSLHAEIAERKRVEEALKQKTLQLEAANKELEAFSYSVSHDLRAPLRIINGFSEMVLMNHSGKLHDEGKRLLNSIRQTALRMDELIKALLDLSKAGRQEMHMRDINMGKLVKDVFDEITHGSSEQTLRLELKMLAPAQGDATLIRQVLANLLSNAIKFTRHRETAAIEVGGWSEDKENVYFVKDNGVGFDPKYADRIFGTFQRLHTLQEFEGTGIGLSIVQRIIVRHGGRVWAEGKPNEGATFYFSLPIGRSLYHICT